MEGVEGEWTLLSQWGDGYGAFILISICFLCDILLSKYFVSSRISLQGNVDLTPVSIVRSLSPWCGQWRAAFLSFLKIRIGKLFESARSRIVRKANHPVASTSGKAALIVASGPHHEADDEEANGCVERIPLQPFRFQNPPLQVHQTLPSCYTSSVKSEFGSSRRSAKAFRRIYVPGPKLSSTGIPPSLRTQLWTRLES